MPCQPVITIKPFIQTSLAVKTVIMVYQDSRFIKGGKAVNTPLIRSISVRLIHAPIISLAAHQRFTDTTNAYRAYSAEYLWDERVKPLRVEYL